MQAVQGIAELGPIDKSPFGIPSIPARRVANPPDYKLQDADLLFLAECVKSQVLSPTGRSFHDIDRELKKVPEHALTLSAIKLERLGYIEKTIEQGDQDWTYYAFSSTADGLDAFLKHEDRIAQLTSPALSARRGSAAKPSSGFDDMDGEIEIRQARHQIER